MELKSTRRVTSDASPPLHQDVHHLMSLTPLKSSTEAIGLCLPHTCLEKSDTCMLTALTVAQGVGIQPSWSIVSTRRMQHATFWSSVACMLVLTAAVTPRAAQSRSGRVAVTSLLRCPTDGHTVPKQLRTGARCVSSAERTTPQFCRTVESMIMLGISRHKVASKGGSAKGSIRQAPTWSRCAMLRKPSTPNTTAEAFLCQESHFAR